MCKVCVLCRHPQGKEEAPFLDAFHAIGRLSGTQQVSGALPRGGLWVPACHS